VVPGGQRCQGTRRELIKQYARRWAIEPSFRDTEGLRIGMRISAFAIALLTMLGTAGANLEMDRLLKSNTSKTRTHALFCQGCLFYELIPNMPEHRLLAPMPRFAEVLIGSGLFGGFL
jgi:hypothetical protein